MINNHAIAAKILKPILLSEGTLTSGFDTYLTPIHQANGLIKDLCFGVLRHYFSLSEHLSRHLAKPLKSKDSDIQALLLIGLYQLTASQKPQYAIVNETVSAAKALKKPWATGMLNAILRAFIREQPLIAPQSEEAITEHPRWLIQRLKTAWPATTRLFAANNQHPPMTCRLNLRTHDRDHYVQTCLAAGIPCEISPYHPAALIFSPPIDIRTAPGFDSGDIFVQDLAAQFAASLLNPAPNARVLDACAAPGGKTLHLLQQQPTLNLLALDKDPKRLTRVMENARRAQQHPEIKAADANAVQEWWDGQYFDAILCDAPCSATGVIRRHPDIKLLRRPSDIDDLTEKQLALLKSLWPTLKPQGRLLYATCSILPEENSDLITAFLAETPNATLVPCSLPIGQPQPCGWQILPGEGNADGFYYALLEKSHP